MDGNRHKAKAITKYFLPTKVTPKLQIRNIKIVMDEVNGVLRQEEFIDLFASQEEAKRMLLKE